MAKSNRNQANAQKSNWLVSPAVGGICSKFVIMDYTILKTLI